MDPLSEGQLRFTLPVMTVTDWLLDSDPAIRCQVLRDVLHEPDEAVAPERARVATEGWERTFSRCRRRTADGIAAHNAVPPVRARSRSDESILANLAAGGTAWCQSGGIGQQPKFRRRSVAISQC